MSTVPGRAIDLERPAPLRSGATCGPAPSSAATRRSVDGTELGQVDLEPSIFGIEPNLAVLHQVVTAQLAAARAGTQSTKTRSEVRGGGAKPFRQKGTGRARQGSTRSPQWVGGGVALGPKPRSYAQKTPKKMIQQALRSALSDRAAEGRIALIDQWTFEIPSTKAASPRWLPSGCPDGSSWCWARRTGTPTAPSAICPRSRPSWPASSTPTTSWSTTGCCSPTRPCPACEGPTVAGRRRRRRPARPPQPIDNAATADADGDKRGHSSRGDRGTSRGRRRRGRRSRVMRDPHNVLIRPVVSEKSYSLMDNNVYVFIVDPSRPRSTCATPSSRPSTCGWTASTPSTGRARRKRNRKSNSLGHRPDTKRAIVTLHEGDSIDLFEN